MLQTHCPTIVSATLINSTNTARTGFGSNSTSRDDFDDYYSNHMNNTKGNDGSSPYQRQNRICRIVAWVLVAFGAYQLLVAHFLAGLVPDFEIDPETGRKRVRRRPERNKKLDASGNLIPRSPLDGVVEGHLHLIDIIIPDDDTIFSQSSYSVKGVFCALEWSRQREDPTRVPLFEDMVRESSLCGVTRHTADLFEVTQNARAWDLHFANITLTKRIEKRARQKHLAQAEAEPIERSIPPTALIFHESRCGSTLVSNVLSSFAPDGSSRVYSEAAPPLKALAACSAETFTPTTSSSSTSNNPDDAEENKDDSSHDSGDYHEQQQRIRNKRCLDNPDMHQQLIRDIFYMMGRAQLRGPEHNYVFYKLQSKAVHNMKLLESAFGPDNMPPWVYLYRDNVHVMQSHLQGSIVDPGSEERNVLGRKKTAKCLEGFSPAKPPSQALQDVVAAQLRTVESLSKEEYCAANLASLSESAMDHFHHQQEANQRQRSVPHFFINYKQLPDVIWDHVLPNLGVDLRAQDVKRMEQVAAKYTQGRKGSNNQKGVAVFAGDSDNKESNAPFAVAQAAQDFMGQTYDKLEELSATTLKAPMEKPKEEDE